jgi:hypothetical protein
LSHTGGRWRTRRPDARRVLGLAVGTLLLSACGDGLGPGVAAEVDRTTIRTSEVDDVASLICELEKAQGQGGQPLSAQRASALSLLVQIEVDRRIGDLDAVPQREINRQLREATEARRAIPEEMRPLLDEVVRDSARASLAAQAAAVRNLRDQGGSPEPDAVQSELLRLQQDFLADHDVEVAPRFGTFEEGRVVAGDGSLSVAVSERARSFQAPAGDDPAAPPPAADLPPAQVCG